MTRYLLIKNNQRRRIDIYYDYQLTYYITGNIARYGEKCFLQTPNHKICAQLINKDPYFVISFNKEEWHCRKYNHQLFFVNRILILGQDYPFSFKGFQQFRSVFHLYRPKEQELETYYYDIDSHTLPCEPLLLLAYLLCHQVSDKVSKPLIKEAKNNLVFNYMQSLFADDHNDESST